jgi:dihydrodipicolinate reductase
VALAGASGRMGRTLIDAVLARVEGDVVSPAAGR